MTKPSSPIFLISIISGLIILTVVGAFLASNYFFDKKSTNKEQVNVEDKIKEAQTKQLRRVLIPMETQNDSGQSGTAQIEELTGGKIKVKISLVGPTSKVPQPAHIHTGSCPSPAAVKFKLNDVISNLSETTVDVSMDALFTSGKLAINVQKSAQESSVYTACGNLPEAK